MRNRTRLLTLPLVLLLVVPAPAATNDPAAAVAAFESFAVKEMESQKIPGLSVAVLSGEFRWSRGFGLADLENGVAARADSSYRTGSVAKPMTAVAILELVEQGKIDLDAEVQTYLPDFPRKQFPVTIRQLLGHQGGISHYRNYMVEGRIREPKTTAEALAIFAAFDLVAEPGTEYNYTTYGYNLLGAVVEAVSGRPYGEFLATQVWKPLGMTSTRMDDPRAIIPHRVQGYTLRNGELARSEYVDVSSRFGGGGARSTVEDMVRMMEGLSSGAVLEKATREDAWTPLPTRDGRLTGYGLGFVVSSVNGRWVVAHGGSQQETRTLLVHYPAARFTLALASNLEDADLGPFEEKLVELFLGDPRSVRSVASDPVDANTVEAMTLAWNSGLAAFDRLGRPMTSDRRELEKAFRPFREPAALLVVGDGIHPVSGEPLTKAGSWMASVLAAEGRDLDVYRREGPFRFFADYAKTRRQPRLPAATTANVERWREQWAALWTPELQHLDPGLVSSLDALEKQKQLLAGSAVIPDYSRDLAALVERSASRGDIASAFRAANLGMELYPRSDRTSGMMAVMTLMSGDSITATALLKKSHALDPNGFTAPGNLLRIASYLATRSKNAALTIVQLGTTFHPESEALRKRLEELNQ